MRSARSGKLSVLSRCVGATQKSSGFKIPIAISDRKFACTDENPKLLGRHGMTILGKGRLDTLG